MDTNNTKALTHGPEYMLGKFANLPDKPGDSKPAEEFQEQFGNLYPGLDPENYWVDVANFREAWHARNAGELEAVGSYLTDVFNRTHRRHVRSPEEEGESGAARAVLAGDARYNPAVKVDFSSGKIALDPSATLLYWLANSLLQCRHRLGICKRQGCATPYFVKSHPRAKYCSELCFRESRLEKKNQWWKDNRGKDSKKSAPTRKARAKKSAKRGQR